NANEPLSDPEAIADLKRMLQEDTPLVERLNPTRRYQYRLFKDIAQVVINRGGIACGSRDEFIFWMLVMRFNAGLYGPDELQGLAGRFSGLTQGGLNLWDTGMLSTLHQRMSDQAEEFGQPTLVNPVIRQIGAFAAVRFGPASRRKPGVKPFGYGQGYARPMVYTPKASTLVERLGITAEEQSKLDCLISPAERLRRDRANSATARRQARNDRLVSQVSAGNPVHVIARRHQVSLATAYRILAAEPEMAEAAAQRDKELSNKRAAALALL